MRSDGMESVLKGVSVSIKPGQRVGVCGRSGRYVPSSKPDVSNS